MEDFCRFDGNRRDRRSKTRPMQLIKPTQIEAVVIALKLQEVAES